VNFTRDQYDQAVKKLSFCMLQEVAVIQDPKKWPKNYVQLPWRTLGGGDGASDVGFMKILENSEGQAPFNILQASLEDTQGISKMQMLKKGSASKTAESTWIGLFSLKIIYAVMMLDFWNPIYSWRRGILMQYVPANTKFTGQGYDLESRFIQNVRDSSYVKDKVAVSPEYQFIQLLEVGLETHKQKITVYFNTIQNRMQKEPAQALQDYLTLAESRRRIFRPLPLDEFGSSMPYALNIPPNAAFVEMTATGQIQPMPKRGVDFLMAWTGSLASRNPSIIPKASVTTSTLVPPEALPRPAGLHMRSQNVGTFQNEAPNTPPDGCPFSRRTS
jgi:hypothetical protein